MVPLHGRHHRDAEGGEWEQDTLVRLLTATNPVPLGDDATIDAHREHIVATAGAAPVVLPAAPLMHGTGHMMSLSQLTLGGCVVTLPGRSLDAEAIWQACADRGVTVLVIVGDAFARPLLAALDAHPGRWDLSRLALIVSSGVMWSQPVKEGLIGHLPQVLIFDSLGSSEAVGMAASFSSKETVTGTARFALGAEAVVVTDDGSTVAPGSGEIGRLGVSGLLPVGYYKDEVKTAATFQVIDGVRYSLPGDWATVEADGSVTLLGRGSVCINTGGEKVFPEEVEEVLKTAPGVVDAVCVAVPDERFGEAVAAVVEPRAGPTSTPPRSSPTSRSTWPTTRRPGTCSSGTPSAAPPTARSTTRASPPGRGSRSDAYRELTYETVGDVGVITLDRPDARNALTQVTYRELEDAVRTTQARCLVVTGADPAFCAGDDVKVLMAPAGERLAAGAAAPEPQLTPAAAALLGTDVPVVAAVNGAAVGWGMESRRWPTSAWRPIGPASASCSSGGACAATWRGWAASRRWSGASEPPSCCTPAGSSTQRRPQPSGWSPGWCRTARCSRPRWPSRSASRPTRRWRCASSSRGCASPSTPTGTRSAAG